MGEIYSGCGLGRSYEGRLEDEVVYSGGWGGVPVGMVTQDGLVYRGLGLSRSCVGRVDRDGVVYAGEGWGSHRVGYVESDGLVYTGGGFGADLVGEAEGPRRFASGAAYLLLFR
ncbi:MAG: hypothetical protein H6716_24095 [Polyangiaceae bacterium]|nr:hypothetical protein [Polyangiaceae bacterium]